MGRTRMVCAWLVVAAFGLAGCSGADDVGPMAEDAVVGDDASAPTSSAAQPLRFVGPASNGTFHANGTFAVGANCDTGGYPSHRDTYDVSKLVSSSVPTVVRATLDYDTESATSAGLELQLRAPDGRFLENRKTDSVGQIEIYAVLVAGQQSVTLEVVDYGLANEQEIGYQLVAEFITDPTLAHPGAPIAFVLGPNATIRAQPIAELAARPGEPSVVAGLLFGPQGDVVERWQGDADGGEMALPQDAIEGGYVLLLEGTSSPVRITVTPPVDDRSMRLLEYRTEPGDARSVAPAGSVTWDFDLDDVPVRVGAYVTFENSAHVGMVEGHLTVTGPEGVLVDEVAGCANCASVGGSVQYAYYSVSGDPNLVPGAYTVDFESGDAAPSEVGHLTVWFDR